MKKNGFTLAEVLITLGIIGVVAAITLPTLMADTSSAQIGPKLAKAVSMFEQANTAYLNEQSVDALTDTEPFIDCTGTASCTEYGQALTDHLKISQFEYPDDITRDNTKEVGSCIPFGAPINAAETYISKDGVLYYLLAYQDVVNKDAKVPHKQRIGNVWIDINGVTKPNYGGTDLFLFTLYNDGSLRPAGAKNWMEGAITNEDDDTPACYWREVCPDNQVPTDYFGCTASVFENSLKILYK